MSTGIRPLDRIIDLAKELGLTVEIKTEDEAATYYDDGEEMIPALTFYAVKISIPIPEEIDGTYLALCYGYDAVSLQWGKRHRKGARPRRLSAYRDRMTRSDKIKNERAIFHHVRWLAEDAGRLKKRYAKKNTEENAK